MFLKNSRLLYEHEVQRNSDLSNKLQKHIKTQKEKNALLNKKMESDKLLSSLEEKPSGKKNKI